MDQTKGYIAAVRRGDLWELRAAASFRGRFQAKSWRHVGHRLVDRGFRMRAVRERLGDDRRGWRGGHCLHPDKHSDANDYTHSHNHSDADRLLDGHSLGHAHGNGDTNHHRYRLSYTYADIHKHPNPHEDSHTVCNKDSPTQPDKSPDHGSLWGNLSRRYP